MTPSAGKQRRNGILTVAAVLAIVCVWWAVFVPYIKQYKIHKREAKLKEALQAIEPPAGARGLKIWTDHQTAEFFLATGVYSTTLDCESVKAHYKEEFARHGFTLRAENKDVGSKAPDLSFSAPDYDANVSCGVTQTQPMIYIINLHWKHGLD